jgi:hypothetical protein
MSRNIFKLGARAKDVVTGFEGIITSYTEYLTGCDHVGLRPSSLDKDGKPQGLQWFDITTLKVIKEPTEEMQRIAAGRLQDSDEQQKPGGPQDAPQVRRG